MQILLSEFSFPLPGIVEVECPQGEMSLHVAVTICAINSDSIWPAILLAWISYFAFLVYQLAYNVMFCVSLPLFLLAS